MAIHPHRWGSSSLSQKMLSFVLLCKFYPLVQGFPSVTKRGQVSLCMRISTCLRMVVSLSDSFSKLNTSISSCALSCSLPGCLSHSGYREYSPTPRWGLTSSQKSMHIRTTFRASSSLAGESGSPFLLLSHPELAPFIKAIVNLPSLNHTACFVFIHLRFLIYINLC